MKKALKVISFALSIIMIVSLFCGCNALDELRTSVATVTKAGDIKLGDKTYIRLPSSETLRVDYDIDFKSIYAVEKDVPLLLSGILGDSYMLNKDGTLLINDEIDENVIYCRSDCFEQIKNQIENGFVPSRYCYGYYKISEDDYGGKWVEHTLTEQELSALKKVLSGKGEVLADNMNVLFDYIANIEYCSEDGYFYNYFCDVYILNDRYTVVTNNETETRTYDVPKELNGIFKNMVDEFVKNEQFWND